MSAPLSLRDPWVARTVGAVAGTLLGSAVGALISLVLSEEAVNAWAWRVPFLPTRVGLGSDVMRQLLHSLVQSGADYVLVDCPPVLPVSDKSVMALNPTD